MLKNYKNATILLIICSVLFRLFLAGSLEFGNDEVYYWLYAKYPALSHFDHPPMVGVFIQFFTVNLFLDSELAIRLAAIVPSGLSMYVVYLIATFLKNERAGFIGTLLYSISIYGFIISGTFILPDAPLVLFWLLSFYFFVKVLPKSPKEKDKVTLLLGFLFAGLAIYSKYQAIYLLFGIVLYVILFNRIWLKKTIFYLGFIFPLIAVLLILYWNYQNDFISYSFHGERVSFFNLEFNKNSFIREVLGQFLYNNPYIVVMIILMFFALRKKTFQIEKKLFYVFLTCSLPLIFTTIYLSISRNTLPHWSGVSYLTLLPLLAVYLSKKSRIERNLLIGFISFTLLLITATFVINTGVFLPQNNSGNKEMLGRKDALLDMYGWKLTSDKLTHILKKEKFMDLPIISNRWYPAAHIDYYIARPNGMKVYGVGGLNEIHKYYWINKLNKPIENKALYITDSRNYKNPKELYEEDFRIIKEIAVIPIERGEITAKYVFLYYLENN